MIDFTIIKCNHLGEEVLRYDGTLIERQADSVCVRAIFQLKTRDLAYVTLKQGDTFIEWFYTNRWYNVFQVIDRDDNHLKGYYCNITRPALIEDNQVQSDDLKLDLFVKPSGEILTLDQDEYDALTLSTEEKQQVSEAIADILAHVEKRKSPFHDLQESAS